MTKKHLYSVAAVALVAATCAMSCPANEFSEIVAFGASLTDGGNVFIASPGILGFVAPPSPPYYNGRFSNGPNYVDVLAELLRVSSLSPSLDGGTNYAWGAATSGRNILYPDVVNVDAQVAEFLSENTPQPDQLFVFGAIGDFEPDARPKADPVQSAAHMRDQVERLIAAGGKHFLIGDHPLDRYREYNHEFHRIAGELRSAEVSIYQFDLAGTINQIIAHPTDYGITNTTDSACGDCGGGLNPEPVDIVDNPDEYLFWDNVHYTAPVNRVMAQAAFDATRELLNEDFGDGVPSSHGINDGGLGNWSILDSSSDPLKPWGPGIAQVQDGALRFHTTGEVPPQFPEITSETGLMIATLDRSAEDERFANGFLRSTVHANTASDTNMLLRADAENLSGYLFTGLGPANEFQILRFENGDGELIGRLNGADDPEFTLGDDWVIEAGAVGNELSMKVWRAGEQEPSEPQLVVYDDVLTSGQIGLAPAISTGLISDPTRLDVTYDDILFRIADLVPDFDACDFDADGDCDIVDLDELQYVGLGGTDAKFDLSGSGGTIDEADTVAWLELKGTGLGDTDLDGDVDATDLNAIGIRWQSVNVTSWANGDFNGDRAVNSADLNKLALNWQTNAAAQGPTVPEPSSNWMLLGALSTFLMFRTSRREVTEPWNRLGKDGATAR